jgi:hypothetical protein
MISVINLLVWLNQRLSWSFHTGRPCFEPGVASGKQPRVKRVCFFASQKITGFCGELIHNFKSIVRTAPSIFVMLMFPSSANPSMHLTPKNYISVRSSRSLRNECWMAAPSALDMLRERTSAPIYMNLCTHARNAGTHAALLHSVGASPEVTAAAPPTTPSPPSSGRRSTSMGFFRPSTAADAARRR